MNAENPIRIAVKVAGSRSALARLMKITPQAIRKYERGWDEGRHDIVPAHRAVQFEKAVGMNRHEFRSDLWPSPTPAEAA